VARHLATTDGAAFHRGERLRRDRFIRKRLTVGTAGWRIVEVRAPDLKDEAALLDHVRAETSRLGG
jgi:hypothetical protein